MKPIVSTSEELSGLRSADRPRPRVAGRWAICILLLWGASGAPLPAEDGTRAAAERRLAAAVRYLASDQLGGRGLGTGGLEQAAQYIAGEFRRLGLKTDLYGGTPYQTFMVTISAELGPPERNRLALLGPPDSAAAEPRRIQLELGKDFNPLAIGGSGRFDLPLVFAGYGITGKKEGYDDYAGLDVQQKAVLLLRKEPQQDDPHSVFNGRKNSRHALFSRKIANAFEHGAAAVILVNDAFSLRQRVKSRERAWSKAADQLAELRTAFKQKAAPSPIERAKHRQAVSRLAKRIYELHQQRDGDSDQILHLLDAGQSSNRAMPVFFCTRKAVEPAIRTTFGGRDLAALERAIDQRLVPQSRPLKGWRVVGESDVVRRRSEVKNVVAVLDGEGPLAEETVVVGAHYDHLGMGGPNSLEPSTRQVHNGADDNASGVAGLLEIARRFAGAEKKPRRRIVFVAFTAEERGLLGSARYVREPPFPLDKTVAMINLDMIGRLRGDKLIIQGKDTAAEFDAWMDQANRNYHFKIAKTPGGFGPSDHSSFYAKQIPVLHIFTGPHRDYHRPTDDFEKINVPGMRRVVDLVGDLVALIVQADGRPHYRQSKRPRRMAGGDRPYFGSIPDFGQEADGYALMGVAKGGPADRAGLRSGDVIIQFGESRIGSLEDFDSALRKYEAGDEVRVVFKRQGKQMSATVRLDPPR